MVRCYMANIRVNDLPIENPDNDLLGMVDFAQTLASFISKVEPPFTLGIYGDWGDGKTSFVNLLRHELTFATKLSNNDKKVEFIAFQAWRYSTADELWRALLLKTAQVLYEVSPSASLDRTAQMETKTPVNSQGIPAQSGDTGPSSLYEKALKFLKEDAFAIHQSPPPDPNAEYNEFATRLDRSLAGSISRSTAQQLQINQEAAFLALMQGIVAALSSMSPLADGIRRLFGQKTEIDFSSIFSEDQE